MMNPLQNRAPVTLHKLLYWAAVAMLVYRLARMAWSWVGTLRSLLPFPLAGTIFALLVASLPIVLWSMLSWNVYRKPTRWGLGVGLFLLATIALNVVQLTLLPPHRASAWHAGNWLRYAFNVTPTMICAACCVSLRWICPAEPKPGEPSPAVVRTPAK